MFCSKCGNNVQDGMKFCNNCGNPMSFESAAVQMAQNAFNQAENEVNNMVNEAKGAYQNYSNGNYNGNFNANSGERLQTDRTLLLFILLSCITCGIYSYYFIYKMAKDVNIACEGDGEKTSGLVEFILLSLVTCGIYSWIWHYKLGNRLEANAPRYGLRFQENGTTVLLWMLFGMLLCGIGYYMAMYILIKNTNAICAAYNEKYNL